VVTALVGTAEVEIRVGFFVEQRRPALFKLSLRDGCFAYSLSQASLLLG
jgi:hypothetical protein